MKSRLGCLVVYYFFNPSDFTSFLLMCVCLGVAVATPFFSLNVK